MPDSAIAEAHRGDRVRADKRADGVVCDSRLIKTMRVLSAGITGILCVTVVGLTVAVGSASEELLDVKSSLAGTVLEDHLVSVGDQVEDAQPLVYVRTTLTGAIAVAARAPADGEVREVLVKPGQRIERGDLVIRLRPR